eukprot:754464-Pelagomonas_calceolata.AAC.3
MILTKRADLGIGTSALTQKKFYHLSNQRISLKDITGWQPSIRMCASPPGKQPVQQPLIAWITRLQGYSGL